METSLYKVTFKDGRVFKVFCQNRNQKQRFNRIWAGLKEKSVTCEVLENGIHNISQWEKIINNEK